MKLRTLQRTMARAVMQPGPFIYGVYPKAIERLPLGD